MKVWIAATFLLCWCSESVFIRETDHDVVFINIPVNPAVLHEYLNDELQPLIYNESAWIAIVAFQLYSLETEIDHSFFPLPGIRDSSIVKTVAFVTLKNGSQKGYMIVDMDFSSEVQSLGCSATQPGVHCYHSQVSNISASNVTVTTQDQLTFKISYKNSSVPANADLVVISTDLTWKYLQKGVKGTWTAMNQTGHAHKPATGITLTSIESNILEHRHKWPGEEDLCKLPGACFFTPFFQFIDKE